MKCKIYKALPAYGGYINSFYKKNSGLCDASFESQLNMLQEDCFQWILAWKKYNIDDDVEIFETVPTDFHLQNAWANHRYTKDSDWVIPIVLEQIKSIQPNICILYSPEIFNKDVMDAIRNIKKDIIIGGYDGMDRQNIDLYSGYDFVITCSEFISKYYSRNGMPTYPMKFGFDPEILTKTTISNKRNNVCFSGSIFPNIHKDRFELLTYILRYEDIAISSNYGFSPNGSLASKHIFRELKELNPNRYSDYLRLYRHNIGAKYGIEMFQFLRNSNMTLNLHGDKIGFAANIRLYEATGVGSCLLTDWKENISSIFEPGKEVVVFHSKEEALDIIKDSIKNKEHYAEIARNGQKRTLSNYSYSTIIPELIKFVKSFIAQ